MRADDLLIAAEDLLAAKKGKPRQANLKRACSTVYYALFHALCTTCACSITTRGTKRAWVQAYRAVNHSPAHTACKKISSMAGFPAEVRDFALKFIEMQEKRHSADYDPTYRLAKSTVEADIGSTKVVLFRFSSAPSKHKRAFAAMVLFGKR